MAEKDGDIIFATIQLAEECLDIEHLDTILFALPVNIQKTKTDKKSNLFLIFSFKTPLLIGKKYKIKC
jgi:hypothetical protein